MERHYYDPGTMIDAKADSKIGCWQLIRNECERLGHPVPTMYDLVEVQMTEDFPTPWVEFSPDMLKDGMELLVRTSDGSHTHCLYRESREFGDRLILMNVGTGVEFPLQEITHAFVINPPKP